MDEDATKKENESHSFPANDEPFSPVSTDLETQKTEQKEASITMEVPKRKTGMLWAVAVISILSSTFLFALDNTVVADVQPKLIETFGEIEKLPWVAVAYGLGSMSVNLLWGKLYGQFDIKILFIAAVFIFEVGSAISGAAPNLDTLIVGRTVCGLGAPGLYIGAINLLTVFTTMSERPLYMSYVGATWCLGTVLGPIIGGAFAASTASWRWAFYINLVVAAAAAPAYLFLIPSYSPTTGSSVGERIKRIDFIGATLFIGASVCLAMGISFGGALYSWNSSQIIGLFVGTGILWLLFIVQQTFCIWTNKTDQLFPAQFVGSYEMCILFALVASGISCVFIPVYFIPLFSQFVLDDSPLEAGVRLLPYVSLLVFGALLQGALLEKFPRYMPWFTCGGLLSMIGGVLLSTLTLDSSISKLYGYSVITAFGAGLFVNLPFVVAQAKVAPGLVAKVNSFISCGQISGITLCLAVANSVFLNQATNKIAPSFPGTSRSTIQGAISGTGSAFFHDLNSTQKTEVLGAIISTISNVYIMVITAAVFVVIMSFFLKRERLALGGSNVQ